jgi:hypothetical protein
MYEARQAITLQFLRDTLFIDQSAKGQVGEIRELIVN